MPKTGDSGPTLVLLSLSLISLVFAFVYYKRTNS